MRDLRADRIHAAVALDLDDLGLLQVGQEFGLVLAAVVPDDKNDLLHVLHVVRKAGYHLVIGVDQVLVQQQIAHVLRIIIERDERHGAQAMDHFRADFRIIEVGKIAVGVLAVEPHAGIIPELTHLHMLCLFGVEHGVAAQYADQITVQRPGKHGHDLHRVNRMIAKAAGRIAPVMQPADRRVARIKAELHHGLGELIAEYLSDPLVQLPTAQVERRRERKRIRHLLRDQQVMPVMRNAVVGHVQRCAERGLRFCLPLQHPVIVLDVIVICKIFACAFGLIDKFSMPLQQEPDRFAVYVQTLTPPFLMSRSQAYLVASIV